MALLERLLDGLEVSVLPFALCDVRGEADLPYDPGDSVTVHYTLAGAGTICFGDGTKIAAPQHSFIVIPRGVPHRITPSAEGMAGAPGTRIAASDAAGMKRVVAGEGEPVVIMACGTIDATYRHTAGLFDYLAEPIVEGFTEADGIRFAFESLLAELAELKPGAEALAGALMKQCLVRLLRRHAGRSEHPLPWLSALEDPRLGKAVTAMLDAPGQPHTLERLAEVAGMSRSAFAARFAGAFGRPAIDFLKEIRLRRAAHALRSSDRPIKAIARDVGYDSRSYFSRAFKAFHGIDPAGYRARHAGAGQAA